jgi:hypothetical protein
LSSSVNTASQPIRWHRTGAAEPLFAASVVVDITGALFPKPNRRPLAEISKRVFGSLHFKGIGIHSIK